MTGNADKFYEAFFLGLLCRFERTASGHHGIPVCVLGKVMELDQVQLVDFHTLKRLFNASSCHIPITVAGLACNKNILSVVLQKVAQP